MLLPLIMLLLTMVVQAGIYFHTRAIAVSSARQAVAAARVESGSAGAGEARAERFLAQNGGALRDRHVTVSRHGSRASATVSGGVVSVMFGIPFSVSVTVDAPVEQVVP